MKPIFKIAKKRLIKETDKSYIFRMSRHNRSGSIVLPKSQIISEKDSFIVVNQEYKEPAYKFEVTPFIWVKQGIKEQLDKLTPYQAEY